MTKTTEHTRTERIGGRLHEIRELTDKAGAVVAQQISALKVEFDWHDLVQLVVGAVVLAVPVAFTEEVWDLGESLSGGRIVLVALTSIATLALFIKVLFYPNNLAEYRFEFLKRVMAAYLVTLTVAMLLLILIGKGPGADGVFALKRAVLIAFPASFAATVVDYVK